MCSFIFDKGCNPIANIYFCFTSLKTAKRITSADSRRSCQRAGKWFRNTNGHVSICISKPFSCTLMHCMKGFLAVHFMDSRTSALKLPRVQLVALAAIGFHHWLYEKVGWRSGFKREADVEASKNLHSSFWPAGTAKVGWKMTVIGWLSANHSHWLPKFIPLQNGFKKMNCCSKIQQKDFHVRFVWFGLIVLFLSKKWS